jgi:uncharacterized protein (TIGR02001 family)
MKCFAVSAGLGLLGILGPPAAVAQQAQEGSARWRLDAAWMSDYRYRGLSLSDRRPSVRVAGAYDDPSGVSVGMFAAEVRRFGDPSFHTLVVPSIGFAQSTGAGQGWDIGVSRAVVLRLNKYNYTEVHVGLHDQRWGARLSFAPHYYGVTNTLYAEVDANHPIDDRWRAFARVGALIGTAGQPAPDSFGRARYDAQTGIAYERDRFSAQLSVVGSNIVGVLNDFSFGENQKRLGIVLSVSVGF